MSASRRSVSHDDFITTKSQGDSDATTLEERSCQTVTMSISSSCTNLSDLVTEGLPKTDGDDSWGWFDELESPIAASVYSSKMSDVDHNLLVDSITPPSDEVLESSLSSQQLWYETAGRRPKQPQSERDYFEKLWAKNFESSNAQYNKEIIQKVVIRPSDKKYPATQDDLMLRGEVLTSNAVIKLFLDCNVTLQIPKYRTHLCDEDRRVYAEYMLLVKVDARTFGIWKRFSDFKVLASNVQTQSKSSGNLRRFRKTIFSWEYLVSKQRWFRCVDKDYIRQKCILLERFMHELLFESATSDLILSFLDLLTEASRTSNCNGIISSHA